MTVSAPTRRSASTRRHARAVLDVQRDVLVEAGDAELFGIAELTRDFGITPRALRFYEDKGLLAPRRVNGARVYTRRDRARLALILRSKAIGASLQEIRHYLELYGAHGEGRVKQLRFVLERTDATIADLEAKRLHIDAALAELRLINAEVRARLADKADKAAKSDQGDKR